MYMRTPEERLSCLHRRAYELKRKREQRRLSVLTAVSSCLFVCLVVLTFAPGRIVSEGVGSEYAGSAMLFESSGGYVLTAVIAFAAGVLVTVLIHRSIAARKERKNEKFSR
jgi:hypothetical protein